MASLRAGYFNPAYWKGEFAKGWMSGDQKVLIATRDHWLATVHEHHAKEIRDGEIDLKVLEQEASNRIAPPQNPYYWFDRRFNQPNQPVVGINWWEAAAFCEWEPAYFPIRLDFAEERSIAVAGR